MDEIDKLIAEVRRLRAELARRDAIDAAWNAGAAEARGRVLNNLAADPRDHMPPEFRADEEIAAAWLAGWAADAAIVRLAEIERERDEALLTLAAEQHKPVGAPPGWRTDGEEWIRDWDPTESPHGLIRWASVRGDPVGGYVLTGKIRAGEIPAYTELPGFGTTADGEDLWLFATARAAMQAANNALKSDVPDGIEVVQVADLQSARDGRAQVLREGASLTIRCVIHDQLLQATHCGGGGGEGMMDLAIPVYRCGVCGYAAHSIDWIQDHIKRWWLPNGAESTRMDIDAERHDGEPWSTQYLRVGDSVMWSVGRGGDNGLCGRVVAIQPDLTWFTVRWADGRSLPYETNDTLWALFPRRRKGVRS